MLSRSGMANSATLWTVACQVPLSMGSSKQEYWSRLPFPTSGDLPNPGIEPASPVSYIGRWIPYHQVTWKSHLLDNTQDFIQHEPSPLQPICWLSQQQVGLTCSKLIRTTPFCHSQSTHGISQTMRTSSRVDMLHKFNPSETAGEVC